MKHEERIQRLERNNRLLVGVLLLVACGIAAAAMVGVPASRAVTATEYRLVDENGVARGYWGIVNNEARFALIDELGDGDGVEISMEIIGGNPLLSLRVGDDPELQSQAFLAVTPGSAILSLNEKLDIVEMKR